MSDNIQEKIVDLLNQALLYGKDSIRVQHLRHIQELILRKDPSLLNHFLEEVLNFQTDKSSEVKKTIISFIEEVCQYDSKLIIKVIDSLHLLLNDENIFVQKKLILSMISIYQSTLTWLVKCQLIDENIHNMWQCMTNIKNQIISMLNLDDDRLCTVVIKFIEMLALTLSRYEKDFSTNLLQNDHKILSRIKLEQEEKEMIEKLLEFIISQNISSVNLIAAIEAITNIVRQRSNYINRIIQTFEVLNVNLSSIFIDSQVTNLRNIIKLKLLNLLKYSISYNIQSQITTLLIDLGATQEEILKYLPKVITESKRKLISNTNKNIKKMKNINDDINNSNIQSHLQHDKLIDLTIADLMTKLSIENVVDLVIVSMHLLPEKIPPSFQSSYTPIVEAGTPIQIEHLARLLCAQLTAAGYQPITSKQYVKPHMDNNIVEEKVTSNVTDVQNDDPLFVISSGFDSKTHLTSTKAILSTSTDVIKIPNIQQKKMKSFKLSNTIKSFEYDEMQRMSLDSFHRMLHAEDICERAHVEHIRQKMMTSLVCLFEGSFHNIYEDYIFADVYKRYDLVFAWIYQEYVYANGYLISNKKKDFIKYDNILCRLLECLQEKCDDLFSRLFISAPLITDNALFILKQYCQDENHSNLGMNILYKFICRRIIIREKCLDILLNFTHNENIFIRNNAIYIIKNLHEKKEFQQIIEEYALKCLTYLRTLRPPETLFCDNKKSLTISRDVWTEDSIHLCLSLYLSLISSNHYLIQPLATIYTVVDKDIKRVILQILEIPIREMGMTSPELLKLIRNCPQNAEGLITRIIHILTQQMPPSHEIVEKIRDLYHKRISDVRLLIPVLTGLEKSEIINALPKFIKLSPPVVKEVFNRLLGLNDSSRTSYTSLILPSELLIALHQISLEECELKTIINATSICFNERSIYTYDILAIVLQQLVEMTPIPILFMRTVLQTFSLYPKMIDFIMNILQRLITKQAWKQTRIWEGFIKCCEQTRPHSFPILLQLPPSQLKHILQIKSELRDGLVRYLRSMSIAQRSSIPSSILIVIEDDVENIAPISSSNPV
ncbi:unnamed protein product [Rotaria sordida]|uniref:Symplekin n=1 Tax=Rotaria sordida TaxID=392033 RepID=A0A813Q5I9_9BILA|nr:unnamed protein product [Rotaria sordida]CAF0862091.1 unnamed protein product [Rotaria sordida]